MRERQAAKAAEQPPDYIQHLPDGNTDREAALARIQALKAGPFPKPGEVFEVVDLTSDDEVI